MPDPTKTHAVPTADLSPNPSIGRSLASFSPDTTNAESDSRPMTSSTDTHSRPQSRHARFPPGSGTSSPARHHAATPTTGPTPPPSPGPAPSHRLLLPPLTPTADDALPTPPSKPLIICFHGSHDTCRRSWTPLATTLSQRHGQRVLLFERGYGNPSPADSTADLIRYLDEHQLPGPYVLIAHSHGGAFARCFLHLKTRDVCGAVLVETGQEAVWNEKVEREQESRCVLGDAPLVVVRGNSLLRKRQELERRERETQQRFEAGLVSEGAKAKLMMERNMMEVWEKEDERLKRRQLKLSHRSQWVECREVGHHVVRDRPDIVVDGVEWVTANLSGRPSRPGWTRKVSGWMLGKVKKEDIDRRHSAS